MGAEIVYWVKVYKLTEHWERVKAVTFDEAIDRALELKGVAQYAGVCQTIDPDEIEDFDE